MRLILKVKKLLLKTEKDLHTMKELGYEHIVSMKNKLGLRIYEKNRMIYVPLIEKIINNCCDKQCDSIRIYKDRKDICIWCKKMDYLNRNNRKKKWISITNCLSHYL